MDNPDLCGARDGTVECYLFVGHPGLHEGILAIDGIGLADVAWDSDCPLVAENEWMAALEHQGDGPIMPPVYAHSRSEDGLLHLEWFRN